METVSSGHLRASPFSFFLLDRNCFGEAKYSRKREFWLTMVLFFFFFLPGFHFIVPYPEEFSECWRKCWREENIEENGFDVGNPFPSV